MNYKAVEYDIYFSACMSAYDPVTRCCMDFDGHIETDLLMNAVDLSMETVPMIACGLEGNFFRLRWKHSGFSSKDIVEVVAPDGGKDATVLRCIAQPMDLTHGPHLRVFVVRDGRRDTLCVLLSHLVADGAGLKEYLYLLASLYTALKEGTPLPEQRCEPRGVAQFSAGASFVEKVGALLSSNSHDAVLYPRQEDYVHLPLDVGALRPRLARRTIGGQTWRALLQFAKTNDLTVNDILLAAFTKAFWWNVGTSPIPMTTTIDLRRWIPKGVPHGISNYSAICLLSVPINWTDGLGETAKHISRQMQFFKSRKKILKSSLALAAMSLSPYCVAKALSRWFVGKGQISGALTNIGILDEQALRFAKLEIEDAYIMAQFFRKSGVFPCVSTYKDCCSLCSTSFASEERGIWIEAVLDETCRTIETEFS